VVSVRYRRSLRHRREHRYVSFDCSGQFVIRLNPVGQRLHHIDDEGRSTAARREYGRYPSPMALHLFRRTFPEQWWISAVVLHALATWFLVGLIWTIHTVHYPLFADVGAETYVAYQSAHVARIGPLLLLPWTAEGVTTVALVVLARSRSQRALVAVGCAAAAGVLLISGFASAPAHGELADGFDPEVHDRLMNWNLIRALLWTVKGVIGAVLLWGAIHIGGQRSSEVS